MIGVVINNHAPDTGHHRVLPQAHQRAAAWPRRLPGTG